jgi:hypothetical protein
LNYFFSSNCSVCHLRFYISLGRRQGPVLATAMLLFIADERNLRAYQTFDKHAFYRVVGTPWLIDKLTHSMQMETRLFGEATYAVPAVCLQKSINPEKVIIAKSLLDCDSMAAAEEIAEGILFYDADLRVVENIVRRINRLVDERVSVVACLTVLGYFGLLTQTISGPLGQ